MREQIILELHGKPDATPLASDLSDQEHDASGLLTVCIAWLRQELMRKHGDVLGNLEAMRAGVHPARQWRAPLYRSRRIAAGVRAAISFALASIFFVVAGWPATEVCLTLVAVLIGLGSVTPNARLTLMLAVLATPLACLLAGILKYFVLDTVSEFQLLAIGLAPFVIGLALLMTLPNPIYSSLGRLTLVFMLAVLAPTNPQTYHPTTFLVTCLFVCLSAILSFAAQLVFPPLSNDRRLQQLLKEARYDLDHLSVQRHPDIAPEEAMFRDAGRVALIVAASGTDPSKDPALDEAMRCFDQAATLRLCGAELDMLASGWLADAACAARTSLAQRDSSAILASAETLHESASPRDEHAASACAALVLASVMFSPPRPAAASSGQGGP